MAVLTRQRGVPAYGLEACRIVLAAALLSWAGPSIALAWNQNADDSNPQVSIRWTDWPVSYRINPAVPLANVIAGPLSPADAVRSGFAAWQQVATATVRFRDAGDTTATAPSRDSGINLVSFADTVFPYGGALAVTPYTYSTQTGALTQASILFNPDVRFSTGDAPDTFDLQSIVTHEIGHFIGLDHSAILGAVMLAFANKNNLMGRQLAADDIAAASTLYPAPGFASSTGSIAGRITGDSGAAVFGAHVVALGAGGATAASGFSVQDGTYGIRGLLPGDYTVFVEPLDGPAIPSHLSSPFFSANVQSLNGSFQSVFHGGGLSVRVRAAESTTAVDIAVAAGTGDLNPKALLVVPSSATSVQPSGCATEAPIDTPGQDLIVAGPGLEGTAQVRITGGDIALAFKTESKLRDGTPALRYGISVPAGATLGARTVIVDGAGRTAFLAGALVAVPQDPERLGPLLSCSYDRNSAAVGPGTLQVTIVSDKTLAGSPRISIDRPGNGNDVVEQPLAPLGGGRSFVATYDALPQNGQTVLDGVCAVRVTQARDTRGNDARGLSGGVFVVDTTPPGGLLSMSNPAAFVGPGKLTIFAAFSEPLAAAPLASVDRPGTGNDLPRTSMTATADPSVYTVVYDVLPADGATILDGQVAILLEQVADRAGNRGTPVAGNSFVVDTLRTLLTLRAVTPFPAAGVGAVSIVLDASKPLSSTPAVSVDRPGAGNDTLQADMAGTADAMRWSFDYVALRDNGGSILDGVAAISVVNLKDRVGNEVSPPPPVSLRIDTRPPRAALTFSGDPAAVPAGRLRITATFDEPLSTVPVLGVDRPGDSNDLPLGPMSAAAGTSVWFADYDVTPQDGLTSKDGAGLVVLARALDFAGNEALSPANGVLVFQTGPEPPIASVSVPAAGRVPAGPLTVTVTFNVPPGGAAPRLTRLPPGSSSPAGAATTAAATADPRIFTAVLDIPTADGITSFDGIHSLAVQLGDATPVPTLEGRFRSVTAGGDGLRHAAVAVPAGLMLLALPVRPSTPTTFTAGELLRQTGASLVARCAGGAADHFQVVLPTAGGKGAAAGELPFPGDFPIEGGFSYAVAVPAARVLRVSGVDWPGAALQTELIRGCNFLALPRGTLPGYTSADLARSLGASLVARPLRRKNGLLAFEPFLEGGTPAFALDLEDALLVVHPAGGRVTLPAGR